jgi:hypothetical protein
MKPILITAIIFFFSTQLFAQINFENGYFIDNNNQKTTCLIKNIGWRSNPESFEYKLSKDGETKTANISNTQEFGVANSLYQRKTVQIDRSSKRVSELSHNRNPDFKEETLFLKVLVQGNGVLYSYTDKNLESFFYTVNDSNVEQLVYKKYYINTTQITENNLYKQQLLNSLSCKDISKNDISKLSYNVQDLTKLFIDYNTCINPDANFTTVKKKKDLFNLSVRPGIFTGNFEVTKGYIPNIITYEVDFGTISGYRLGLEAELILPFNKNKWSIIAEPTFHTFKSETISLGDYPKNVTMDYKSLEIPLGIRHYFFLNQKSKIFANISFVYAMNLNSTLEYERNGYVKEFDISRGSNFAYGFGYNYLDTYAVEVRYNANRNILSSYLLYGTNLNSLSLILSYNLL